MSKNIEYICDLIDAKVKKYSNHVQAMMVGIEVNDKFLEFVISSCEYVGDKNEDIYIYGYKVFINNDVDELEMVTEKDFIDKYKCDECDMQFVKKPEVDNYKFKSEKLKEVFIKWNKKTIHMQCSKCGHHVIKDYPKI